MLEIKDLTVKVEDKEILKDFNLNISSGEIHALLGPNGIGKSTICKTILGDKNYTITKGTIKYKDQILNDLPTHARAKLGIFLLNQTPLAIEGVTNADLLRSIINEKENKRINIFEFNRELLEICKKLDLPSSFIHRDINVGASGGERKKTELLHMWILKPDFIILDEVDSGLDVDALKLVASSLKEYHELYKPSILIISHHQNLLKELNVSHVHVIKDGHIEETGNLSLVDEIAKKGFNRSNKVGEN